ncbi:hydroxyacid dehydrogenase [Roseococcus sp. SYP-B2431]|uniref:NAD(P)-dependent oxidoreductase n=1 Tax=Roseococcus sp. SYP-B2431 TaxID=2496640 RepID=UPI0010392B17|nr:NAD(P)-dependent oxidoreductase [Roseococcus sp. SYP-B2431]TCH99788.1 hydroxyacid dehydrogenase [Roseococcus sp. SYP-B2431]
MRVLLHYRAGPGLAARLSALPGLDLRIVSDADDAAFAAALPEAEAIWHVLRPLGAADIAAAPRLRLIQKIGVGVNTIDLDAARARGIAVCNLPGTNSRAVAELTLALMLAALRKLAWFDAETRAGRGWSQPPEIQDGLFELGGRTVGLVGHGAIPTLLAPVLAALGCRILYTARAPKPEAIGEFRTLDALLAESDVVSLHIPETPETRGLIGRDALARMKRGAVLVNTARGGLVDQAALVEALRSGHLAAAGLDVFAAEPADPDDALFALPNVVVAPHVGWLTTGTFERSFAIAAENVRRLASGEALLHRVA